MVSCDNIFDWIRGPELLNLNYYHISTSFALSLFPLYKTRQYCCSVAMPFWPTRLCSVTEERKGCGEGPHWQCRPGAD